MYKKLKILQVTTLGLLLFLTTVLLINRTEKVSAVDLPVEYISNIYSDQTWTAGRVYYVQGGVLTAKLTIQPGAIVKFSSELTVETGGVVEAKGTELNPIIFTSYKDDGTGGDSNGDGSSSAGPNDYAAAFSLRSGADVSVEYAQFKASRYSMMRGFGNCEGTSLEVVDSILEGAIESCPLLNISLERNQFDVPSNTPAIALSWSDATKIVLSGPDKNVLLGQGRARVITLSGEAGLISAGKTWAVAGSSGAVVEGGYVYIEGTLKLEEGSIFKGGGPFLSVKRSGHLIVEGSADNRVVITSISDDRYGGDTNNDGQSDPYLPYYETAIRSQGGEIDVKYAILDGMNFAATDDCRNEPASAPTYIADSILKSSVNLNNCAANSLVLERNQFAVRDNYYPAVSLSFGDASGIALAGPNQNTFVGNGRSKVVSVGQQAHVSPGKTWNVAGSSGAVLEADLSVKGTLNLQEGAIIKTGYPAIRATSGGVINVQGSSANKVIFTSSKDDTVGGDTNSDGATTGDADIMLSISDGAKLNANNALFKSYANFALNVECTAPETSISVSDSAIKAPTQIRYCQGESVSMERNTFEVLNRYPLSTCGLDLEGVKLAGSDRNTFVGTGLSRAVSVSSGRVNTDKIWEIDGTSNAVILAGDLGCGSSGPGITVKGTLKLGPGAIIKHNNQARIKVESGGVLDIGGTASNRVILTSLEDDSAAGDTNSDGASSGSISDYSYGILAMPGSTINASNGLLRYASIAVDINDADVHMTSFEIDSVGYGLNVTGWNSQVVYRGKISNASGMAVQACNWGTSTCRVNVAFTDWNDIAGPALKTCGQMISTPWKYNGQIIFGVSMFMLNNCSSQTPPPQAQLNSATFSFAERRAMLQELCNDENQQAACDAWERNDQCIRNGIIPIAEAHYGIPMPTRDAASQAQAYGEDVAVLFTEYVIGADSDIDYTQSLDALAKFKDAVETMTAVAQAYRVCSQ